MDIKAFAAVIRPFLEKEGYQVIEGTDSLCLIGKETVCLSLTGGISKEAVLKALPPKKEAKSFYTTKHDKEEGGSASAWNSCLYQVEQAVKRL